jgi:hypothetical protein
MTVTEPVGRDLTVTSKVSAHSACSSAVALGGSHFFAAAFASGRGFFGATREGRRCDDALSPATFSCIQWSISFDVSAKLSSL